jgi:hypothetical protein
MKNVPIVGALAGLAMFVWEAVAHMALPLGQMGLSTLPNEGAVRAALAAHLGGADGFYFFPAAAAQGTPPPGPWGLLLYHPAFTFSWSVMGWEMLIELVMGLALAMLIGLANVTGFGRRMAIACLVGIAAAFAVSPSDTIWFGFPAAYSLAQMVVTFGDYIVGGLVIAALLRARVGTAGV